MRPTPSRAGATAIAIPVPPVLLMASMVGLPAPANAARTEPVTAIPILTIGYEAARFEQVRDALVRAGTTLLIDVRAVASSRRAGFSKRVLAGGLAEARIGYLHLQPLGTPKDGRDAVRRGEVDAMRRIFRAHMAGDRPQAALAEAGALAAEGRVCLLCFERDHDHCHRALVADMIADRTSQAVRHLRAAVDGPEPRRRAGRAEESMP